MAPRSANFRVRNQGISETWRNGASRTFNKTPVRPVTASTASSSRLRSVNTRDSSSGQHSAIRQAKITYFNVNLLQPLHGKLRGCGRSKFKHKLYIQSSHSVSYQLLDDWLLFVLKVLLSWREKNAHKCGESLLSICMCFIANKKLIQKVLLNHGEEWSDQIDQTIFTAPPRNPNIKKSICPVIKTVC